MNVLQPQRIGQRIVSDGSQFQNRTESLMRDFFRGKSLYVALNAGCIDWLRSTLKTDQSLLVVSLSCLSFVGTTATAGNADESPSLYDMCKDGSRKWLSYKTDSTFLKKGKPSDHS